MAERMLFAGMDVGTSGCKMLVYDLDGNIVYQSSRKYQEEGSGGHRELNPEIVISKVKESSQGDCHEMYRGHCINGSDKSWRIGSLPG